VSLGGGADVFTGGTGSDTITGGAGADQFVFTAANQSGVGTADVITDFVSGTDKLVFQGLLTGGSFTYDGTAAFTNTGHSQARFDDSTHTLEIDVDGDGTADMEIKLNGKVSTDITASDFTWS
jgi:Ca2+-binding RTX toxin-like protein